jgi:hypothetical protein
MSDCSPKLWKCEQCGVILGLVRRGSGRIGKLDVFRFPAWPSQADKLAKMQRGDYALVALEQGIVRCGHCGADRAWNMGDQALEDLLANRKKRKFGLALEVEHAE